MKNPQLYVITLALLAHHSPALAHEPPPGWRWYNEPKVMPDKPKPLPSNTQTTVSSPKTLSATEQIAWFHSVHIEAQNDAVLHPKDKQLLLHHLF